MTVKRARRRPRAAAEKTASGWVPTRKWIAAQVVAAAAIATSAVDSGWDGSETKLAIAWAVQAAVTYLLPNADTPGGVPLKR